jgi:YfiH family protein
LEWREENGVRWLEARLRGVTTAFSSRVGGVSEPPFHSLNLGILNGDARAAVLENRRRLVDALGLDSSRVLMGLQVHGSEVLEHVAGQDPSPYSQPGSPMPEVDGHATSAPRLAPLVLVADCLPIALFGPGGVAMLHCGWRGLAAGLVARGARMVRAETAAIGPGIGPCCYEVGPEVLGRFEHLGDVAGGRMLDLAEVARRQLRAAGVERIESAELCTSCEPDLFFSSRRDGPASGRQAGLAWLDDSREGG